MGLGIRRQGTQCLSRTGFMSESGIKANFTTILRVLSLPLNSIEKHSLIKYSISVYGIPNDVLFSRSVGENQCSGCRGSKFVEYSCAHHISAIWWVWIFLVWLRINHKMLLSQISGRAVLLDLQSCHPQLLNEKVVYLWSFDLFLYVHTLWSSP